MEKLTTEMEISDTAESDDITDGISSYVDETNTWIDGILTSLGWTREYILQVNRQDDIQTYFKLISSRFFKNILSLSIFSLIILISCDLKCSCLKFAI